MFGFSRHKYIKETPACLNEPAVHVIPSRKINFPEERGKENGESKEGRAAKNQCSCSYRSLERY